MEAIAKLKKVPISPRKVRLVADMIRKKNIVYALNLLDQTSKKGAQYLSKLIKSAIANWHYKHDTAALEKDDMYIEAVKVDPGSVLKRVNPAAQGRANRIRKRTSHITITVNVNSYQKK